MSYQYLPARQMQPGAGAARASIGLGTWLLVMLVTLLVAAGVAGAAVWLMLRATPSMPPVPMPAPTPAPTPVQPVQPVQPLQPAHNPLLDDALKVMPADVANRVAVLRPDIAVRIIDAWKRGLQTTFGEQLAAMEQPDFAFGDVMRQPLTSPPGTLSPYISRTVYASRITAHVLETLARRDADDPTRWIPVLGERCTTRNTTITIARQRTTDPATGKERVDDTLFNPREPLPRGAEVLDVTVPEVTWTLREGLCFSDGHALTSADVAFTLQFIRDERINAARTRAYYAPLVKVEAPDARTVVFTFIRQTYDAYELCAGIEVLPGHIYRQYLESDEAAADYNNSTASLVGSGPYRLENADRALREPVRLVRNVNYWGVVPPLDGIEWYVVPDDIAALLANQVDVAGVRVSEWADVKQKTARIANAFEYLSPTAGYTYIAWNERLVDDPSKPSPFADVRVRRAMTHLIDRERIVKEIHQGRAIVAKGPFHPAGTQSDKDLSDLAYDRAEAARQLAAAGYTDTDGDGIVDRNGDPLSVRIIYPAGSDDYRKTITFVRDCLARGGVRVELQQMEFSLMIDAIESRKFEAISLGWTSGVEVNIRQMFHSDQIPAGGDNFMSYSNPALDALLDKAVREPDPALRTTLWRKCERIVVETQPYTFLARRQSLVVVHNRFANVRLRPSGTLNYDGYAVYVPLDRQRGR